MVKSPAPLCVRSGAPRKAGKTLRVFAERLRQLRETKGENSRNTADKLGLSLSTYLYYEQERTQPTLETLVKIAKHFRVSVDYLLGLKDEK
jgi:transcriptional regulator with XRE-family HTH domain